MSSIVALSKVLQISGEILMFNSSEVFLKSYFLQYVAACTQSMVQNSTVYPSQVSDSSAHLARLAHLDANSTVCCQFKAYH